MYIDKESLNSKDFKKIEETFNDNLYSNDLINFALEERFSINKNRIEEFMKENKVNSNDAIKNMYFELFELENDEYTLNKLNEYEILNFKELSINDYLNDPYYKDIKIKEIYKNGYHLYYRKYIPYEIFLYKDITLKSKYYEEINHIGYFNDYFSFLSLDKDDVTWMSITPHEINTMKDYIKEMKGKCLIYGLGLGYFPYLISLKKDVEEIVIIEKDSSIIDIFNENIFPFFEFRNKIKIIQEDAFKHFKNNNEHFDSCFIDLYHNPIDGLKFYLYFLNKEKSKTQYYYWIEDSILCYIRRMLITIIDECKKGCKDNDYQKAHNFEDKVINSLYFATKEMKFDSIDDLLNFLSNDSIKTLIKGFNFDLFLK